MVLGPGYVLRMGGIKSLHHLDAEAGTVGEHYGELRHQQDSGSLSGSRVGISRSAPLNGCPSTRLLDSPLAEAALAGHSTSARRYGTSRLGAPQQTSNPGEAGAQLCGAAATQREGQGGAEHAKGGSD